MKILQNGKPYCESPPKCNLDAVTLNLSYLSYFQYMAKLDLPLAQIYKGISTKYYGISVLFWGIQIKCQRLLKLPEKILLDVHLLSIMTGKIVPRLTKTSYEREA